MHLLIYLFLALILLSLVSALTFLVRDGGQGRRMVKALTWRIALSLLLFLMLMAAFWLGWLPAR
ncbi:MAG TPA: twin transmembrane helix small protein [Parasulfuritortus sp.]